MAKKKVQARRVPRASEPRMYGDGRPSQQATGVAAPVNGVARSAQPAGRAPTVAARVANLTAEYSYVPKDLRRLGITAVALFALMVVLGFIIR